jgi:hypothetical protein
LLNCQDIPISHEFMTLTLDVFTLFFVLYHLEVDNKTVHRETAANSKPLAVSYISGKKYGGLLPFPPAK